jgi:hypothetical protein
VHFEEAMIAVAVFVVVSLVFIFGLFWQAFLICREEMEKRLQLEVAVNAKATAHDDATLQHWRNEFAKLEDDEKASLEQLAIRRRMPSGELPAALEISGFATRENAQSWVSPQIVQVVNKILDEWRALKN